MKLKNTFLLSIVLFLIILCNLKVTAQTRGLIYENSGIPVLDPNGDGYVSLDSTGFLTNDYTESEIAYTPIPVLGTEPDSDPIIGSYCSDIDIVDNGSKNALYVSFISGNLLFRFRVGSTASSARGYSIMVDSDQKFGFNGSEADPNAIVGNPGFEFEIVLETGYGIGLYDVDGLDVATIALIGGASTNRPYASYAQKSISLTTTCGDLDYFYDFYVPMADLTAAFSIDNTTPLRFVGATVMDHTAFIGSSGASDIGGTGDFYFGDIFECIPPISADGIGFNNTDCRTTCPLIDDAIANGATTVTGTSIEQDGTIIEVFKNGSLIGTVNVSAGIWSLSGISPALVSGDEITATAKQGSRYVSFDDCDIEIVECSPALTNLISNNAGVCGDGYISGAILRVYHNGIEIPLGGDSVFVDLGLGNWAFKCNGDISGCTSGSVCLGDGFYEVTQQELGSCESDPVGICKGGIVSASPSINPNPIKTDTDPIQGTGIWGSTIILYQNNSNIGIGTVDISGNWFISPTETLIACSDITAGQIESNECRSALSAPSVTVLNTETYQKPIITGNYCILSGPVTTVTGSSVEEENAVIDVLVNGSSVGTTLVSANGTWEITGLMINIGEIITAKVISSSLCLSESPESDAITITQATTNTAAIIGTYTENETSVSGSGTDSRTVKLYQDGVLIGQSSIFGGWNIATPNGNPDTKLYAGGMLTVTETGGVNCESEHSAIPVIVQCLAPANSLTLNTVSSEYCENENPEIIVESSEEAVIYTPILRSDSTQIGYSGLGDGNNLTLTLYNSLPVGTTLITVKAIKYPGLSVSCDSVNTNNVSIQINPIPNETLVVTPSTTSICRYESLDIIITGDESGIRYQLKNASNDSNIGSSAVGDGSGNLIISTGPLDADITIKVNAVDLNHPTNCSIDLDDTEVISVTGALNTQNVSADNTTICQNNSTNINVATDNDGFSYQIKNSGGVDIGTAYTGDGNSFSRATGNLIADETFYVEVDDGTGCTVRVLDEETVTVLACNRDIYLEKTVDDNTPNEGQTISFTINVTNNELVDNVTNLVVTDVLPAGLTFISANPALEWSAPNWTVGTLNAGATETLTITATVDIGTSGDIITNTVSNTQYETDDNSTTDDNNESVTVTSSAALSVTTLGNESGPVDIVYTVTLSAENNTGSPITFDFVDLLTGTATGGTDYTTVGAGAQIIVVDGASTGTITIPVLDDLIYEITETVNCQISNSSEPAVSISTASASANIINNESAPTVTLSANPLSITENTGTSTITATLSVETYEDVIVNLSYYGTATGGGIDYNAAASTITIVAGNLSGTTDITAVDDAMYEGDKTVSVDISAISGGAALENGSQSVTITITEDESAPTVTLSASSVTITENPVIPSTLTATLSIITYEDVIVNIFYSGTATGGVDYSAATSITVTAGNLIGTTNITPVDDAVYEENETVIAEINTVIGGAATENGIQTETITITSNEPAPTVTLSASSGTITESPVTTSTLTATLSVVTYEDVSIDLLYSGSATGGGTDYTASASITITAGNLSGTTDITSVDDLIYELNETVVININTVNGGGASENGVQNETVTITSDETAPNVTLSVLPLTIIENGGISIITATLSVASYEDVTVNLSYSGTASGGGTDYNVAASIITIAAGNLTGITNVTSVDDLIYETNETIVVNINSVTGGGASENGIQSETVMINDDADIPTVTLSTNPASITENPVSSSLITVTLSNATYENVTVDLLYTGTATGSGTDYSAANSIIITAGNLSGTTNITGVDDVIYEENETVIAVINNVTGGGASEDGVQSETITITSDESAPIVSLNVGTATITENPASSSIVTATLSVATYEDVIVNLTYSGTATGSGTDYNAAASITISAGNLTGTTNISAIDDLLLETNESIVVEINTVIGGGASESGVQSETVTITDDETATADLSVTLNGNEAGGPVDIIYTVTLNVENGTGSPITFDFVDQGTGTALSGQDYTAFAGIQISVADGSNTGTFTIEVTNDLLFETTESVIAQISNCSNDDVTVVTASATANIIDNDPVTANLSVTAHGNEAGSIAIEYSVTLSSVNYTGSTITFDLNDLGTGTALSGTDYNAVGAGVQITIDNGSAIGTVSVPVIDDDLFEAIETVIAQITNPSNTDVTIITNTATADIIDNENINASLSVTTHGNELGPVPIVYSVTFDKPNNTGIPITFDIDDLLSGTATSGTDFSSVAGAAQISIADNENSGTFNIIVIDDAFFEADETINVQISNCSNADVNIIVDEVSANIIDDEVINADLSVTSHGDEAGSLAIVYTVTLSSVNNTGTAVTFDLDDLISGTATSGTDYTAISGAQISVDDGTDVGIYSVSVTDDLLLETTETVIAQISNPGNPDVSITTDSATADIFDNETATTDLSVMTHGNETGPVNIVYTATISRVNNTGSPITFDFDDLFSGTAINGSDYSAVDPGAQISVVDGTNVGTITILVIDDALLEITETFNAQIINPSNSSVTITTANATADITDNETPTADISVTTHGDESGPVDIVYTITMSAVNSTGTAITFDFDDLLTGTAISGTDYTVVDSNAQIIVADGTNSGDITVPIIDDIFYEPTETIDAGISNVSNANVSMSTASSTANIFDDDFSDIVLTKTVDNNNPNEGDDITFAITVTNNGPSQLTGLVVTDIIPVGLTLISATPSIGTWSDPDWTMGTLNIASDETITIITNVDPGTNGNTIINTVSNTQDQNDDNSTSDDDSETINVNDIPVANNDTENVDEDNILFSDVLLNDAGLSDGGILVTIITDVNNGILILNADGTFSYTPDADYHGADSFVYEVCDVDNDCNQASVYITINSVNDLPVAQDDDININEDSELNEIFILEDNGYDTDYFGGDGPSIGTINLLAGTQNGILEFNDNATPDDPTDDYYIYSPKRDYFGSESFEYEICDSDGDCDQAIVNIEIINDEVLFIPEVFTPNGDGFNDFFVIEGLEMYPESLILIFNRWGNKVFEASPYNNDWDGSANFGIVPGGNKLSEGTYFFIIKTNTDQKELKGYIYLKK